MEIYRSTTETQHWFPEVKHRIVLTSDMFYTVTPYFKVKWFKNNSLPCLILLFTVLKLIYVARNEKTDTRVCHHLVSQWLKVEMPQSRFSPSLLKEISKEKILKSSGRMSKAESNVSDWGPGIPWSMDLASSVWLHSSGALLKRTLGHIGRGTARCCREWPSSQVCAIRIANQIY